jgi:quinohemoprotein ethanol dehydrogenase
MTQRLVRRSIIVSSINMNQRIRRIASRICVPGLALIMMSAASGLAARDAPLRADDWTNYGRDGSEQHYSPLTQITLQNVDKLHLAWHYDLEPGYSLASPVAAEGKLFITSGHSHIRALDASTGKLLWEYDAKTREISPTPLHMAWGNKGLAYWNGRVFIATTDGRVIALDAGSGKPVWEQRDFGVNELRNGNGPPRVFNGKVIIGHGGADISPIRGYVSAYDAMTGKLAWRFYSVPGDPSKPAANKAEEVMRPTWKGEWFGKGGGGTAWNAFSYDAELNLLYLGIGNGFPYNHLLRSPGGGDNLFLASIVAVNADTGEYVWHYQVCPAEQWDCTAVQDMTIATLQIEGKPRKVVMQAPKNGFFYVLDAATGQFISAEKISKVTWAERIDQTTGRPVENPGIRYQDKQGLFEMWPGPQGAHSWLPQAFSPRTGLVYIPIMELGALVGAPRPGAKDFTAAMGVTMIPDAELPGSRRSFLKAWNPLTQQAAWTHELPGDWPGGVLATAGDLVFQGRIDSRFLAYDAKSGKEVWSFKTEAPIVAAPISYGQKGRQFVTVLTGSGSQGGGILATGNAAYRTDYRLPRQVLTFAIDGKDTLPPFELPALVAPQDPDFHAEPERITQGATMFAMGSCLVCHGMNAIGGGAAPDLRYSPIIVNKDAFKSIVKDGALKLNGMPAFAQLGDEQLELIRYYLRFRAKQTSEMSPTSDGDKAKQAVPGT